MPLPKIETLTDNFNTTFNTSKWGLVEPPSRGVKVSSGKLRFAEGVIDTVVSVNHYDLTGSRAYARITPGESASFNVYEEGRGGLFSFYQDTLTAISANFTVYDFYVFEEFPFDRDTQKWFQLRESGGTLFWETSPDGYTWNVLTSAQIPCSNVYVEFNGSGGTTVDSFNTH